jgi:hypothetical protein
MGKQLIEDEIVISLENIEQEKDLKPREDVANIIPSPQDERCVCCGRHADELEPFGAAGGPLVGDFDGALLVRKYRTFLPPPDIRMLKTYHWMVQNCEPASSFREERTNLAQVFGEKDTGRIIKAMDYGYESAPSYECRDCAILEREEYFERLGVDLDAYYSWLPGEKEMTDDEVTRKENMSTGTNLPFRTDGYLSWPEFKKMYFSEVEKLAKILGLNKGDVINTYQGRSNFCERKNIYRGDVDWMFVDGVMETVMRSESKEEKFSYLRKLKINDGAKELFDEIYRMWLFQLCDENECFIPKEPRFRNTRSEPGKGDIAHIYLLDRDFRGRTYVDGIISEDYANCHYPVVIRVKHNSDMTGEELISSLREFADFLEGDSRNIKVILYGGGFLTKDVETQVEDSENHEPNKEISE